MADQHRREGKHGKREKETKRAGERGNQSYHGQCCSLARELAFLLVDMPDLVRDLPSIAKSLDVGEYVALDQIRDQRRRTALVGLMSFLPVRQDSQGWCKATEHTEVSASLMGALCEAGAAKLPRELSESESLSTRYASTNLLGILESFPDLRFELRGLLGALSEGSAVDLEELENEDIREVLEKLFRVMGLTYSPEGYSLPQGWKRESVCGVLEHTGAVFEQLEQRAEKAKAQAEAEEQAQAKAQAKAQAQVEAFGRGSRSTETAGSASAAQGPREAPHLSEQGPSVGAVGAVAAVAGPEWPGARQSSPSPSPPPVQGPSMPSVADILAARQAMKHAPPPEEEESEDDWEAGPQRPDHRAAMFMQAGSAAQPLGFAGAQLEPSFERAFAVREGPRKYDDAQKAEIGVEENKREEWILTPGDSSMAKDITGGGLQNRKFQTGKQAKKLAEKMSIQREFQNQQEKKQQAQEGGGEESAEPAVASLMDQHLAKRKGKDREEKMQGPGKRRAFDRELDVLSRSKMDKHKVAAIVENSRELNSRFSTAGAQKSFM